MTLPCCSETNRKHAPTFASVSIEAQQAVIDHGVRAGEVPAEVTEAEMDAMDTEKAATDIQYEARTASFCTSPIPCQRLSPLLSATQNFFIPRWSSNVPSGGPQPALCNRVAAVTATNNWRQYRLL